MAEWHYMTLEGAAAGPVSVDELKALFTAKAVSFETNVWCAGREGWCEIDDEPQLKMALSNSRASALKWWTTNRPRTTSARAVAATPPPPPPQKAESFSPAVPPAAAPAAAPAKVAKPSVAKSMLAALKDGTRGKSTTGERRKLSGKSLGRASASAHWVEKRTVDGVAYYHNQSLDKVTYEKPGDLQTDAERARGAGGPLVWIRDEAEAWVAAAPVGPAAGLAKAAKVTVSYKGRTVEVVRSATEPLWLLNEPSSLERLEQDLVLLDEVNEATMVHTLRARYMRDELYTWVGASHTVLVAINPFKRLPLYGVARMHEFARPAPNAVLPPHPFAVANTALRALATGDGNQAILISGESGAGKTEATKQCLAFLAEVSGSATHVEHKLLSANPVLEAFGNAKTVRNDNSSRFGRWMEVHFDSRNAIHSAKIENYLLEKNRVTAVAHAERSYHIFYCLCASGQFKKQGVAEAAKHAYLAKSKCVKATGVDDAGDAAAVAFALDQLGFDAEAETQGAFSLAAGVLRLGDVAFVAGPDGEAVNAATEPLADAAALLGVDDASKLGEALLNKAIDVRGLRTLSPQSPEQARAAADALAKSVYGKIFDWLVRRINAAVSGDANAAEYGAKERFIGILDIFGFEIFEKNSFEQTCINYANEKLQQHFNAHTFRDEEALYRHEGIAFQSVPFIDNGPVLDLLEKKPDGLLLALDDEVVAPQGSNAKWLARCDRVHAAKKTLWKCDARGGKDGEGTFTVSHYAGDVEYSAAGFCDKNSDPLGRALYDVMALQAPVLPLTKALFPPLGENPRRTPTIAGQFRRQLAALMVVVNATRPLYVRCVKPNAAKKPRKFAALPCVEQLTYAGVFEAVEIRKAGYPFRLTHARFAARYRPLVAASAVGNGPPKARAAAILKALTQQNFTGVKVGASMVLYRAAEHRVLELRRNLALEDIVPVAQRGARRGMGRGYRRVLAATRAALAQVERSNDAAVLDAAVSDALEALGPRQAVYAFWPPEFARCAARRAALQERLDLDVIFEALLADDGPSYDALADAVRRADRVEEGTAAQADLESRVRVRLAAAAAARLEPLAAAALAVLDRAAMELVLREAGTANYESGAISQISDLLSLSETDLAVRQLRLANEQGDDERVVNREVRVKQLVLETFAALFQFQALASLRDAQQWASSKAFFQSASARGRLAAGMLSHVQTPIHLGLTDLSAVKGLDKQATMVFKNILGYCGDRKLPTPEAAAAEALNDALRSPHDSLRVEIYCQLMKQLTRNKNATSAARAWELLAAAFASFPPPALVENHVALFIKTKAPEDKKAQLTAAMYAAIYGGGRKTPLGPDDVPRVAASIFGTPVSPRYQLDDIIKAPPPR